MVKIESGNISQILGQEKSLSTNAQKVLKEFEKKLGDDLSPAEKAEFIQFLQKFDGLPPALKQKFLTAIGGLFAPPYLTLRYGVCDFSSALS